MQTIGIVAAPSSGLWPYITAAFATVYRDAATRAVPSGGTQGWRRLERKCARHVTGAGAVTRQFLGQFCGQGFALAADRLVAMA